MGDIREHEDESKKMDKVMCDMCTDDRNTHELIHDLILLAASAIHQPKQSLERKKMTPKKKDYNQRLAPSTLLSYRVSI